MNAAFGWLPPSSSEKPTIDSTASTCGIGRIRFSTCRPRPAGALDRGAVRQLHDGEDRALVLFRQEARSG